MGNTVCSCNDPIKTFQTYPLQPTIISTPNKKLDSIFDDDTSPSMNINISKQNNFNTYSKSQINNDININEYLSPQKKRIPFMNSSPEQRISYSNAAPLNQDVCISVYKRPVFISPTPKHRRIGTKISEISNISPVKNSNNEFMRFVLETFGEFSYEIPNSIKPEFNSYLEAIESLPFHKRDTEAGIYQGQVKDEKRNGKGKQIWNDGSIYEGYWLDDQAFAKGRLVHNAGDVYEGFWKEDQASGPGVYYSISGSFYNGNWVNDRQHGYGIEIWENGAKYEGNYFNGLKEGKGNFIWQDGSNYYGDFHLNIIEGKGVYKWKDGKEYKGDWKGNKMNGKGMMKWTDGKIYSGEFANDQMNGWGMLFMPDGEYIKGIWTNGVFEK